MIQSTPLTPQEALQLADFSFEHTVVSVLWIQQDARIFRVNQAACQLLGYTQAALEKLSVFDIDPNASPLTWGSYWQKLTASGCLSFASCHRSRSGELLPVQVTAHYLRMGQREYSVAFATDLTAQQEAETVLQKTQERYALVIKAANDGIWDWDFQTRTLYFSERWQSMLGLDPHEMGNTLEDWLERIHPEDLDKFQLTLDHYRQGRLEQLEMEHRIRHKNGQYLWVLCRGMALRDYRGELYRIAGSMTDITERRRAQAQLLFDALHDPLTGLPNRTLLLDQLTEAIAKYRRGASDAFAVLFLDLDRFKLVNDSLGHRAGDQLLRAIAHRLSQALRPEDTVARLGGDEFIVLLKKVTRREDATETAQRILQVLALPIHLDDQVFYPRASIGIALSDHCPLSAEDYLRRADIAMYQAKARSQPSYALFTAEMQARAEQRLQLEVDLQRAIAQQEFELKYQPIVCLRTQRILGFEALLRWNHPQRGLIPPHLFIPIAEETGQILTLGNWVLQQACTQMQYWNTLEGSPLPLFVTVNLSSQQVSQPNFAGHIQQILAQSGVQPNQIKLEITESTILENTQIARDQLLALKQNQMQICMDDFGTGYSSLSYLHQLPIDYLKIDQSFVQQIRHRHDNPEVIRAILAIAQSLNMGVIAEGIETHLQADILREIGCPQGQGYLFDHPLTAHRATALLQGRLQGQPAPTGPTQPNPIQARMAS
ncbi:sensor domain-containing protein [Lyngbya confervoides]|uniref:EAL domain-containing protein n=1 Tax=Lyngbya confervoides BDU141951 TaxID=1574623 RepID=A0ABD4T0L3_9CYAN|nr:EAL domain-containing protein [Lyngbya confervoides]MCM1981960.1 EAL domain-containing protein [Lyngbya confervoides BDU141951]